MHSASLATVAGAKILRLESTSSTQDVARYMPIGSIVLADYQAAGRGRLERRWVAPRGTALLVSFVLSPHPLLSLAAGVAASIACGRDVRLKWPNDLLLGGRKVGGLLVEVAGDKAVCGIGVNLTAAPAAAAQLSQSRDEVLGRLCQEMERWTNASPDAILERWRELSETLGRMVRIEISGRVTEGLAQDIGGGGELIVDGEPFVAGSVTHL